MQNRNWFPFGIAVAALLLATGTQAQEPKMSTGGEGFVQESMSPTPQVGHFITPASGTAKPGFAHTTYKLGSLDGIKPFVTAIPREISVAAPAGAEPDAVTLFQHYEVPQSLGCIYVGSPSSTGCITNYNAGSGGPSALGHGAIALVDAYDAPTAAADLATFDSYWGLAAPPSFTVLYANGNGDCTTPPSGVANGWSFEESLDVQWAHVFAPKAAIILVEACSNSDTDLFYAEQVAFSYIATNFKTTALGGGEVSNSWQGGELAAATQYADDVLFTDHYYTGGQGWYPPIQAFASSGDGGFEGNTTGYPSGNPWLVSAGGTGVYRNAATNYYYAEHCWNGSGGGYSAVETWGAAFPGGVNPWNDYQYQIFGTTTNPYGATSTRVTPDFSFDADPNSGVYVYCTQCFDGPGWYVTGGTSVSSPSLASISNRANNRLGSVHLNKVTGNNGFFSNMENTLAYATLPANAQHTEFYDVTIGNNTTSAGTSNAGVGYDTCTGLGASRGLSGK